MIFMVGMLVWKTPQKGKREKGVILRERSVLHVRLQCAEILRGGKTPEAVIRRRIRTAAKRLQRLGVRTVILPADFEGEDLLEPLGLRRVSTLPLRQMLAADWVRRSLEERSIPAAGARVAVIAGGMTGAVVRTVTELALRHRYVMLQIPYGGEDLCHQLRREYGVSMLLKPGREQLDRADVTLLFEPWAGFGRENCIAVFDEAVPLPPLSLPPALEDILPPDAERIQMLEVLLEAGVLRPGQIAFRGGDF
jgi:hypothetical protein